MKDEKDRAQARDDLPTDYFPGMEALIPVLASFLIDSGRSFVQWKQKDGPLILQIIDSYELENDAYLARINATNINEHSLYMEHCKVEKHSDIKVLVIANSGGINSLSSEERIAQPALPILMKPNNSVVLDLIFENISNVTTTQRPADKYGVITCTLHFHCLDEEKIKAKKFDLALRLLGP